MNTMSYGRRAAAYWSADGFPQIFFGLMVTAGSVIGILLRLYAPGRWARLDLAPVAAGIVLYYPLERSVLDLLKSHFTYPRTGYVQPPEDEGELRRADALTILTLRSARPVPENVTSFRRRTVLPIFLIFSYILLITAPLGRWLTPAAMVLFAVPLYVVNRRAERLYRWWSTAILALAGLPFLWVDLPTAVFRVWPTLLVGLWLLAEGAYTLVHYLRANPRPPAAAEQGVRA
jgi:hypothetical protein